MTLTASWASQWHAEYLSMIETNRIYQLHIDTSRMHSSYKSTQHNGLCQPKCDPPAKQRTVPETRTVTRDPQPSQRPPGLADVADELQGLLSQRSWNQSEETSGENPY